MTIRLLIACPDGNASSVQSILAAAIPYAHYCGLTIAYTLQNSPSYDGSDLNLGNYDEVLIWTNGYNFTNASLGTNLGNFIQGGGGAILSNFSFCIGIPGFDYAANSPWSVGSQGSPSGTLGVFNNTHPIMAGVGSFSTYSVYVSTGMTLNPGATQVAAYTDGTGCVAVRSPNAGKVVGLNFFPAVVNTSNDDGMKVMINSVIWAFPNPT
jgi:hypothetical protein